MPQKKGLAGGGDADKSFLDCRAVEAESYTSEVQFPFPFCLCSFVTAASVWCLLWKLPQSGGGTSSAALAPL